MKVPWQVFVAAASLAAVFPARAADLIDYDENAPELRAQRERQAQQPGIGATMRSGDPATAPALKLPVLELPSAVLLAGARSGTPGTPSSAVERVAVTDDREGLWYAITDTIGDVSITVSADLRMVEGVQGATAAGAGFDEEGMAVAVADRADDEWEAPQARVVVKRYGGLQYVIEVECAPETPLCYRRGELKALARALVLSYAPPETQP
jgi:hypothetical protein